MKNSVKSFISRSNLFKNNLSLSLFVFILLGQILIFNPLIAQPIREVAQSSTVTGQANSLGTIVVSNKVITAVRAKDNGGLKLISWSRGTGPIRRLGDNGQQTGEIGYNFSMIGIGGNKIATLIEYPGSNSRKKIILWFVESSGRITRLADSGNQLGRGGNYMNIYYLPTQRVLVTAIRDSDKKVNMVSWKISATGQLLRKKNFVHREGYNPKMGRLNHGSFGDALALAYQGDNARLKLSTFRIDSNGNFNLIHETGAGKILSAPAVSVHNNKFAVAMKTDNTKGLKIIVWSMDSNGRLIRKGEAEAGAITPNISMARTRKLGNDFILTTAIVIPGDRLKLINWRVTNGATRVTRIGASPHLSSKVTHVTIAGVSTISTAILTDGRIKLHHWRY